MYCIYKTQCLQKIKDKEKYKHTKKCAIMEEVERVEDSVERLEESLERVERVEKVEKGAIKNI